MGRIVGQVQEKWLVSLIPLLPVDNPPFGSRGKQVGGISAPELIRNFLGTRIQLHGRTFPGFVRRVMIMAVPVTHVTKKVIKAAPGRVGPASLGAGLHPPLPPVLAQPTGRVSRLF